MDQQKVITDTILATMDTIYTLQIWLGLLETWRKVGQAQPEDFLDACQQLKDADLWQWASRAGGHDLKALATAVGVTETGFDDEYHS